MRLPTTTYLASGLLLASSVLADDVLRTDGFSNCADNTDIFVNKMDIEYNKGSNVVTFDVSGTSEKQQDVMGTLVVSAYGNEVYRNSFDPCDEKNKVDQLCPSK